MKKHIFILLFLIDLAVQAQTNARLEVVDGDPVKDMEQFPWAVQVLGSATCTGVLISNKWVLTAGHCVSEYHGIVEIVSGTPYSKALSTYLYYQTKRAKRILVHEEYKSKGVDLALVELESAFHLDTKTQTIEILDPTMDSLLYAPNKILTFSGWGYNNAHNTDSLKAATYRLVDTLNTVYETAGLLHHKKRRLIVTHASVFNSICGGDSGGPLVVFDNKGKPYLAGITIGLVGFPNLGCRFTNLFGFTNAGQYKEWIKSLMNTQTQDYQVVLKDVYLPEDTVTTCDSVLTLPFEIYLGKNDTVPMKVKMHITSDASVWDTIVTATGDYQTRNETLFNITRMYTSQLKLPFNSLYAIKCQLLDPQGNLLPSSITKPIEKSFYYRKGGNSIYLSALTDNQAILGLTVYKKFLKLFTSHDGMSSVNNYFKRTQPILERGYLLSLPTSDNLYPIEDSLCLTKGCYHVDLGYMTNLILYSKSNGQRDTLYTSTRTNDRFCTGAHCPTTKQTVNRINDACFGETNELTPSLVDTSIYHYSWWDSEGNLLSNEPVLKTKATTNFFLHTSDKHKKECSSFLPTMIRYFDQKFSNLWLQKDTLISTLSENNHAEWYVNDTLINGYDQPFIRPFKSGTYTYRPYYIYTNGDTCKAFFKSNGITVYVPVAEKPKLDTLYAETEQFSIFPNPIYDGNIHILPNLQNETTTAHLIVRDMLGSAVYDFQLQLEHRNKTLLSLSKLAAGAYVLEFHTPNSKVVKAIVKN